MLDARAATGTGREKAITRAVLDTATGGLAGLRERVRLAGADVRFLSSPRAGTRVEVRFPAHRDADLRTGASANRPANP